MAQWECVPVCAGPSEMTPGGGRTVNRHLGRSTWTEVADGLLLVVPLGATEQHGPHLPVDTDTTVATELATRLVAGRSDAVLAPPLPYGASGEHQDFPGTLSLGAPALESVLVELVRSADRFKGTVLVSGHGGNAAPLQRAFVRLAAEGRKVMSWSPSPTVLGGATPELTARLSGDHHAGLVETSIMLALSPESVRVTQVAPGRVVAPLAELMPRLLRDGVSGVSADGVLGDPTGASAELGHRWLAALAADLARRVGEWAITAAQTTPEGLAR
ncbi:MAG TPA: mycofactocin biosynthesis peptidyl-dipeptidase MftE [Acidimicrobiales bacterium]|nr:mycofactocin biosynthesis peptidyl-dipeptidase MftE [Acidimicrobiales bacterium]